MIPVKYFLVLLLTWSFIQAENAVKADPDFICSGLDYFGATAVKIGDCLRLKFLETGGFVDSRDKRLRVSGGICIYKQDIPTQ
jgi:hypothetical protein